MATEWGVGPWCSLVRLVFDTNIAPPYNKLFKLSAVHISYMFILLSHRIDFGANWGEFLMTQ